MFGGFFLTEYCIEIQIRVHDILRSAGTSDPTELAQMRVAHVLAADAMLGRFNAAADAEDTFSLHLHRSLARLIEAIEEWCAAFAFVASPYHANAMPL